MTIHPRAEASIRTTFDHWPMGWQCYACPQSFTSIGRLAQHALLAHPSDSEADHG